LLQAPMAGSSGVRLALALDRAGGLAALPAALQTPQTLRAQVEAYRADGGGSLNLNFFCHAPPAADAARDAAWADLLGPDCREFGVAAAASMEGERAPFDAAMCEVVEAVRPRLVSFHFGLPAPPLIARVKAAGALIASSATTLDEALWLETRGCDFIIAQGLEAGGHRGHFRNEDLSLQLPLRDLLAALAGKVTSPIIAAGGLMTRPDVEAALAAGAAGVQIGTAFLRCPESDSGPLQQAALARAGETALTNLLTGRPARGLYNRLMRELGPMHPQAPAFPTAGAHIAPLRAAAEAQGRDDFTPLWAGANVAKARAAPAADIVQSLL
jgi:nitronate monooxygenase